MAKEIYRHPYANRIAPYMRAGMRIPAYLRAGIRMYQSYRSARSSSTQTKRVSSGQGVTNQYDRKTVYRKKRMPYRKKKNWIKFSKKVNYVVDKSLAKRTIVLNDQFTLGNNGVNLQCYGIVHLYGKKGTSNAPYPTIEHELGQSDVSTLMGSDTATDNLNEGLRFCSGILDMTIRNYDSNDTLEVDLYEIMYTKDIAQPNFISAMQTLQSATPAIGSTTPVNLHTRGMTPFDISLLLQQGIKIQKKTKYLLAPNECATYQIRDPKNYQFKTSDLSINGQFITKYKTRSILIVVKNCPSLDAEQEWNLTCGVTRKYSYVIPERNTVLAGSI